MSLLMMEQGDHEVLLVSDTLVTSEGAPKMFQSKVWPLANFNMVMAVTGTANIGAIWFYEITTRAVAGDIEDFNLGAPQTLRDIYAQLTDQHGHLGSSTIYHFGFPRGSEKVVRYVYRSSNNFEPERHEGEDVFRFKPRSFTWHQTEWPALPGDFIDLATRLREENDRGLSPNPVEIGGELYVTKLTNWYIQSARWHQFPDYEDMLRGMFARHQNRNAVDTQEEAGDYA